MLPAVAILTVLPPAEFAGIDFSPSTTSNGSILLEFTRLRPVPSTLHETHRDYRKLGVFGLLLHPISPRSRSDHYHPGNRCRAAARFVSQIRRVGCSPPGTYGRPAPVCSGHDRPYGIRR